MEFTQKANYTFDDLVRIMQLLRTPQGCPWDKKQTHRSIRQNFIEETYEVVEAIDKEDTELLKEELGDVLLQVVFHAQIEAEAGSFNINDVSDGICKKLIIRHPHVFSDVKADTPEKVLSNWDKIKMETKSQSTQGQAMESISKALPSLMRSAKIQQKAAKIGFDWKSADGAFAKVEEELGDLLFSVVNVSRFVGADAEKALYNACDKFIKRFSALEQLAAQRGIDVKEAPLNQLDSLWDEVKECQK